MSKEVKKPLKLCHLADLHLGYRRYNKVTSKGFNQREVDVNLAFREAVDNIINLKPDLILIAGDLFHSIRPSNAIITFCFRQIRRLAEQTKAPVVIIAGNHDSPKRSDSGNLLRLFIEIEGVYLADTKIENFHFKELSASVTCIPHFALAEVDKLNIKANDNYQYNFLLAHAQVGNEFFSDFGGADLDLRDIVLGEWDYIALGHVHIYQELGTNIAYSGSIEHTSKNIWSEAEYNKGFLEVSFPECKKTFYSLTSPREVLSLDSVDVKGLEPEEVMDILTKIIQEIPGGIDGKILRLELRNLTRNTYSQLDHKKIREWRGKALNFMLEFTPPKTRLRIKTSENIKKPLRTELIDFCNKQEILKAKKEEVSGVLLKYIDQLESINEASGR